MHKWKTEAQAPGLLLPQEAVALPVSVRCLDGVTTSSGFHALCKSRHQLSWPPGYLRHPCIVPPSLLPPGTLCPIGKEPGGPLWPPQPHGPCGASPASPPHGRELAPLQDPAAGCPARAGLTLSALPSQHEVSAPLAWTRAPGKSPGPTPRAVVIGEAREPTVGVLQGCWAGRAPGPGQQARSPGPPSGRLRARPALGFPLEAAIQLCGTGGLR
ncbi:translation initiation factor IF-2-like isoform X2 [Choloepus didactylus]|nr:translation initiation factor IF-2-like isoform X2 [Choloepus didactylus]